VTVAPPRVGSLAERVAEIVASIARVPASRIGPFDRFASLGLDSLSAMELTAALEHELGLELPATTVYECPDLDTLCRFLEDGCVASPEQRLDRMRADARLPRDIVPSTTPGAMTEPTDVLLTGGTGFVGAYLLRALLDRTTARVHCIVRAPAHAGLARIADNLERYGLRTDDLPARVRTVRADIAQPLLGLTPAEFSELSSRVQAIYHAAANVNWVLGYEGLRDTNVSGTRELLRLACTGACTPLHFLSSVSVCHSTAGPRAVDEGMDPMASLAGLRLGYAQSKCVAESLVRDAGERGLPVTIIRPSLVTGDAKTGRSNLDDLTSRFIAGCLRMRAAPDLDWRMDCVPVDQVAGAVVALARAHRTGTNVLHLTAESPKHWRECVLWMRLCGYELELVPYREWAERLRLVDATHPLHALRSFFLHAIAAENHLTLPELFEESRRTSVTAESTRGAMRSVDASIGALDARLLARYFDDFVERGLVPDAPARLRDAGARSLAVKGVSLEPLATDDSIVAELTALRSGAATGLFQGVAEDAVQTFVKAKSEDRQTIEVARALASLASPDLGQAVEQFQEHLGFTRSHVRELALYEIDDPRLRGHMPRVLGVERNDVERRWIVSLEWISDAVAMNATDPAQWNDDSIDAALAGLAQIHSVWYGRERELSAESWLPPLRDAAQRERMTPLWMALFHHARDRARAWRNPQLRRVHERLLRDVAAWAACLDAAPRTLIHNDFNPRNIAIRQRPSGLRLCAFDWELATIGVPQRDAAELMCFVLPSTAPAATVSWWSERYRALLAGATGAVIDRTQWNTGFRAALCDLLVDRLASYAMIDRIRPQRFLTHVTDSWLNIHSVFPWNG
jgi:thioester reductase-like protein